LLEVEKIIGGAQINKRLLALLFDLKNCNKRTGWEKEFWVNQIYFRAGTQSFRWIIIKPAALLKM
jgi:hypothetical protein